MNPYLPVFHITQLYVTLFMCSKVPYIKKKGKLTNIYIYIYIYIYILNKKE